MALVRFKAVVGRCNTPLGPVPVTMGQGDFIVVSVNNGTGTGGSLIQAVLMRI